MEERPEDTKNKRKQKTKRLLSAALMAGAMVVPGAGTADAAVRDLAVRAAESDAAPTILDSQASWQKDDLGTVTQQQWGQVTWGQITWLRTLNKDV